MNHRRAAQLIMGNPTESQIKESGAIAYGPPNWHDVTPEWTAWAIQGFNGVYCGAKNYDIPASEAPPIRGIPCGPGGMIMEWCENAFCHVEPNTHFTLDEVTARFANGSTPEPPF